jgi:hypothetical protein
MTLRELQQVVTGKKSKQRGPAPERLKLSGTWMADVGKALTKKAWPKPKMQRG